MSKLFTPEESAKHMKERWAKARADAERVEQLTRENKDLVRDLQLSRAESARLVGELQASRQDYADVKRMAMALLGAKAGTLAEAVE